MPFFQFFVCQFEHWFVSRAKIPYILPISKIEEFLNEFEFLQKYKC